MHIIGDKIGVQSIQNSIKLRRLGLDHQLRQNEKFQRVFPRMQSLPSGIKIWYPGKA